MKEFDHTHKGPKFFSSEENSNDPRVEQKKNIITETEYDMLMAKVNQKLAELLPVVGIKMAAKESWEVLNDDEKCKVNKYLEQSIADPEEKAKVQEMTKRIISKIDFIVS